MTGRHVAGGMHGRGGCGGLCMAGGQVWDKVIFSETCVSHSVHGGLGGSGGAWQGWGAYMTGGMHAGGVHGRRDGY